MNELGGKIKDLNPIQGGMILTPIQGGGGTELHTPSNFRNICSIRPKLGMKVHHDNIVRFQVQKFR